MSRRSRCARGTLGLGCRSDSRGHPQIVEYLNASLSGLIQVFGWPAFGLMLIGIGLGFVVGILPGLGGPTTLAIMLPFVFKMNPVEAFAFLLGMAAVTNTTGDITSILFGIPGEPTTASTIVDGHPMAKHGEAGRALGAAIMSSLFGAVFGALVLALAIPVVRPLVLTFGSPEFFMLALLGITFVASLSGEAILKGLVAGCLGLWLATIGLAPVSGIQRYTFGQLFLWDGIGLVPVTIGFFAIPEVIDLAIAGSSIATVQVNRLGGVWQGVRDTFTHWALVLRCSAIGTFIAIIPGMGAATTQWLAYAHAVQSSKNRGSFGQGRVESVLGPGGRQQLHARRQPRHHHRVRRPRQRDDGDPHGRVPDPGLGARAVDAHARAQGASRRHLLDGVDDRGLQRDHGGDLFPVPAPAGQDHPDPGRALDPVHPHPDRGRRRRREERVRG